MKEFTLTKHRRARVWTAENELSNLAQQLPVQVSQERAFHCTGVGRVVRRAVAVELLVPVGGRFLYGLLGVVTAGNELTQGTVKIARQVIGGGTVTDSLAEGLDLVFPWIDDEYHDAVLKGAAESIETFSSFPATVLFHFARQGELASSENFFHRLARICIFMLSSPDKEIGDRLEELLSLPNTPWHS